MPHAPSNRNLTALLRDRRGVVGIYFAVVLTGIVLLTMAGLDMIRVHLIRSRMWAATDAALLAGGKALADATWQTQAANYFNANMGTSYMGASVSVTAADFLQATDPVTGATTVSVTVKGKAPLLSAGLMDVAALDMEVSGEAKQVTNQTELAMVLDNTGSMDGTSIIALRNAATTLMNVLSENRTVGNLTNARVALVPYSAAVNPGKAAEDWVEPKSTVDYDPVSKKLGWKGCVIERGQPNTISDTPPSTKKWGVYKWPNSSDNKYTDESSVKDDGNNSTGPNVGCPTAITPLTNDIASLRTAINAMRPWFRGGTLSDIGLAWGMRVLSPGDPFTQGVNNQATGKVVVLMTDGETNFNGTDEYTGYKRLSDKFLGTSNESEAVKIVNDNITSLCNTLRASNVIIYTITFKVTNQKIKDIYQQCAGDTGKYVNVTSDSNLTDTFRDIATGLTELTIVK